MAADRGTCGDAARATRRRSALTCCDCLAVSPATPTPFDRLGCNIVDAASGENLVLYGAAILTTVQLSGTYADHDVRVGLEKHLQSRAFSDATILFGYIGLPATGALLYGAGLLRSDAELEGAGAAAIQAMSITFTATVLLKVATGRPYPKHGADPRAPDHLDHPEWSREWNGPRLENSAWPSGHTSVAVSLASSLTAYWVDVPWIGYVSYPLAAAVGFGVVSGADHWLSDAVAGAFLGQAVGWSVGTSFRRLQQGRPEPGAGAGAWVQRLRVVPLPEAQGVALVGTF